jgi:ABC-type uncharacterized transport system permease subunit
MDRLANAAAPALLLAVWALTAAAYGVLFFSGRDAARRAAVGLLPAAVTLHFGYLAWLAVRWRQFPVATVSQALCVVAFAIAITYLFLEWRGRERATGFWVIAQVTAFQLLALVLHEPYPPRRELFEQPLFGIHAFLALLGYAAFAVAASYGFLFLRLYTELKRGRFSVFYGKLPPLEVLERMMAGALAVGFIALSGALIDGAAWAAQFQRSTWISDPMVLLTFATWALYGIALLMRRSQRWQGRQTAFASLAGLGVIVVSLVAVHALMPGFHRSF